MAGSVAIGVSLAQKDVDFYIHELYEINFFGAKVYITTTHVCTLIIFITIIALAIAARRSVLKKRDVPSKFATGVELAISTLDSFVHGAMGKAGKKYINYIGTLFLFIRTFQVCSVCDHRQLIMVQPFVLHSYHLL